MQGVVITVLPGGLQTTDELSSLFLNVWMCVLNTLKDNIVKWHTMSGRGSPATPFLEFSTPRRLSSPPAVKWDYLALPDKSLGKGIEIIETTRLALPPLLSPMSPLLTA